MDLSKITRGLFSVKEPPPPAPKQEEKKIRMSYQDYGFHQANQLDGTIPGLRVCLQKVYLDFKEEVKNNHLKQEELKKPSRVKMEEHLGNINRWENRIKTIRETTIPQLKHRIDQLMQEKAHIRKNPQEITGDGAGNASFYIGAIILIFLTVYLFVFYSSASYSAFFKEFSINEIGVANSIFDAKALSKAVNDGFMELVLILTIPFVFLGLGYLIHKLQELKGYVKLMRIALLVIVTFVFDAILAYEITEKIYNIKKDNSFNEIPEFSVSLAITSINFWLIIFAGFIVYLIWGFVFDMVIEAFGKIDKAKVAIQEKERQITEARAGIDDLNVQIDKMSHSIDDARTEIKKLEEVLDSVIIPREFELDLFHFMAGWLAWMRGNRKTHDEIEKAELAVQEFVKVTIYNHSSVNPN